MTAPLPPEQVADEPRYVAMCEPCIAGEGSECHTPECAFFLHDVPRDGCNTDMTINLDQRDGYTREQALLSAANFIESDMGHAWGGDANWLTTGQHVAKLVAGVLRERAHESTKQQQRGRSPV